MPTNARIVKMVVKPNHEPLTEQLLLVAKGCFYSDHGSLGDQPVFLYGVTAEFMGELLGPHRSYSTFPHLGPNNTPVFAWKNDASLIAQARTSILVGLCDERFKASLWHMQVWDGDPNEPPTL